jgi:hypothetical protein
LSGSDEGPGVDPGPFTWDCVAGTPNGIRTRVATLRERSRVLMASRGPHGALVTRPRIAPRPAERTGSRRVDGTTDGTLARRRSVAAYRTPRRRGQRCGPSRNPLTIGGGTTARRCRHLPALGGRGNGPVGCAFWDSPRERGSPVPSGVKAVSPTLLWRDGQRERRARSRRSVSGTRGPYAESLRSLARHRWPDARPVQHLRVVARSNGSALLKAIRTGRRVCVASARGWDVGDTKRPALRHPRTTPASWGQICRPGLFSAGV